MARTSTNASYPSKGTGMRSATCSPKSSFGSINVKKVRSAHGKRRRAQRPNTMVSAGFAFAVRVGDDEATAPWHYVTFDYGRTLSTSLLPHQVFTEVTPKLHEFWKRVVLDDAFEWEGYGVWSKTLKLVEVFHETRDVTLDLFLDEESYTQSRKLAALSKLSDEEARLLDIGHEYFFLKISQEKANPNADEILAHDLRQLQERLAPKTNNF